MRIIDNYIIRNIMLVFFSCMMIFIVLIILIDAAGNMDDFIKNELPFSVIFQYYMTFLPTMIVHTSSVACLIATLFSYSLLNNNNELIALRASGLNFWKVTRPAICFAIIVSTFIFLVNERFVPEASVMNETIKEEKIKVGHHIVSKEKKELIHNLTFYGLNNRLYFVDVFDPNTMTITGVTIVGQDDQQRIREKVVALKGEWTGIAWKFHNVQMTNYETGTPNESGDMNIYREKFMDIKETPEDFMNQRLDVTAMNILQLSEYIERFSLSGASSAIRSLKVDLFEKMALPFGNIMIVLAGLPFALVTGRRKALTFTSIGIAVAIGFLYYVINAVGLALGKGGALPPILAAWMAPIIFCFIAVYFIRAKFN